MEKLNQAPMNMTYHWVRHSVQKIRKSVKKKILITELFQISKLALKAYTV